MKNTLNRPWWTCQQLPIRVSGGKLNTEMDILTTQIINTTGGK